MNKIVEILMERDNMSQEEAEDLLSEARDEAEYLLENDGQLDDIENVLKDYFSLEPDYIFDLIDL
jgi:hypothetical protein